MISIYVDDFFFASSNPRALQWLKNGISNKYNVKNLGKVCTIIGWQVTRNCAARILKIDQSSFIQDLIKSENMIDCNLINIPMKVRCFIEMSEPGNYEEVDIKPYQRLIEKLMYLLCGTRLDIAFAVGQLSKHNLDCRAGHIKVAKKVMRYLKEMIHLGLVYESSQSKASASYSLFDPVGYEDTSYAGDSENGQSVMGYCYFLNRAIVSWYSKKQRTISTSTTKAKYIALGHVACEAVWLRCFLNELQIVTQPVESVTLYGDNKTSITLTKNDESQHRTKHINVQYYYIRELIKERELEVKWICSTNILADKFTKALSTNIFCCHRASLGIAS